MHGFVPPLSILLHGMAPNLTQGQLYRYCNDWEIVPLVMWGTTNVTVWQYVD
jgi:hypothetical protein